MGDLSTHFSRAEFACKCGCGYDSIDYETLAILEDVRGHFGQAITVTSAHRCEEKNAEVGGAKDSQHLRARAVDFQVAGVSPADVQSYLRSRYQNIYGIGAYATFTHLDTRSNGPARWGN